MCDALLQTPVFLTVLKLIDMELAAELRAACCQYCHGVLDQADFPRKPRGVPANLRDEHDSRFSFCCRSCRKRHTAMSVRFLGRRVYLGLMVVLLSAKHVMEMATGARVAQALAVPMRTLERWRNWWQERFMQTKLWQAQCARFMPPVSSTTLPGELLHRFADGATPGLPALLVFLTPLSIGVIFDVVDGQ